MGHVFRKDENNRVRLKMNINKEGKHPLEMKNKFGKFNININICSIELK